MQMKDELDILKEIGSISAGQGSVALSEILGRRINLTVPSLETVSSSEACKKLSDDQIVISIYSSILTGIQGKILFLLEEKSAFKLVDLCYSKVSHDDKRSSLFTEMGMSLIKEVGNVVTSSFVGALSMILKILIIPSIPTLSSGPAKQILSMASSSGEDFVLFIETVFEEPQQKITGSFYLVLDPNTAKFIQDACKKLLDSISK